MRSGLARHVATFALATGLYASTAAGAQGPDFVLIAKGGVLVLRNDSQQLADGRTRNFDSSSDETFALAFEIRQPIGRRHAIGVGAEHVRYEHSFTPQLGAGDAHARVLMATVKYYYRDWRWLRPFAGLGLGGGRTNVDNTRGGDVADDNTVYQLSAGAEIGGDALALYSELKFLRNYSFDRSSNDYDASAVGAFIGASWHF